MGFLHPASPLPRGNALGDHLCRRPAAGGIRERQDRVAPHGAAGVAARRGGPLAPAKRLKLCGEFRSAESGLEMGIIYLTPETPSGSYLLIGNINNRF